MAIVTYTAPAGDAPLAEMFGFRFLDGQPIEIEETEATSYALGKLRGNQHFEVLDEAETADGGEAPAKKRGRPFKVA